MLICFKLFHLLPLAAYIVAAASDASVISPDWDSLIPLPAESSWSPKRPSDRYLLRQNMSVKVKDVYPNRPSELIASTAIVHQPFFDNFKYLLNGIFDIFLSNHTVPDIPQHVYLTYVPLVGNLYLDIKDFKVESLVLSDERTSFDLLFRKLVLNSKNVFSNVSSAFVVTKEDNSTFISGSVYGSGLLNLRADIHLYPTIDNELGMSMTRVFPRIVDFQIKIKAASIFTKVIDLLQSVFRKLITGYLQKFLTVLLKNDLPEKLTEILNKEISLGTIHQVKVGNESFRNGVLDTVMTQEEGLRIELFMKADPSTAIKFPSSPFADIPPMGIANRIPGSSALSKRGVAVMFDGVAANKSIPPALTLFLRQPLFDSFAQILPGVLQEFVDGFNVDPQMLPPSEIHLPVINENIVFKIDRLMLNKVEAEDTKFLIIPRAIQTKARSVISDVCGDFTILFANSTFLTGKVNSSSVLAIDGNLAVSSTENGEIEVKMDEVKVSTKTLKIVVVTSSLNWLIRVAKTIFNRVIRSFLSKVVASVIGKQLPEEVAKALNEEIYLGSLNIAHLGDYSFRTSVLDTQISEKDGMRVSLGLERVENKPF